MRIKGSKYTRCTCITYSYLLGRRCKLLEREFTARRQIMRVFVDLHGEKNFQIRYTKMKHVKRKAIVASSFFFFPLFPFRLCYKLARSVSRKKKVYSRQVRTIVHIFFFTFQNFHFSTRSACQNVFLYAPHTFSKNMLRVRINGKKKRRKEGHRDRQESSQAYRQKKVQKKKKITPIQATIQFV